MGPARDAPLNILLLADFNVRHVGTVGDHLDAFKRYSRHNICLMDARTATRLAPDLTQFDVVVLHYSVGIDDERHLPPALARQIENYTGYKILYRQDEYRQVDRTAAAMARLGIDLLYTVVNPEVVDAIYHHPEIRTVRRRTTLTGFVPAPLTRRDVPAFADRAVDVGYRARRLSGWLGAFGQEKWQIGARFKADATTHGLACNIESDEGKRLYGDDWIDFVAGCKAVLGTESGASFVDFSGRVQPAIEAYELANPKATFEEIQARFLEGRDGDITVHVISPRCFEAAALRTLMILYPGDYSGILVPGRHYVPLEKDHGNMADVVSILRDPARAQKVIDAAYDEVARNPAHGYRGMVEDFDGDLDDHRATIASRAGPAAGRASAAALNTLEQAGETAYRRRGRIANSTRHLLYVSARRTIEGVIPASWRPGARRAIKWTARNVWPLNKLW